MAKKRQRERNKKTTELPFQQITRIYLILMATAFLLFPGLHGYQAIVLAKYRAFLVLCGAYLGVMLLLGTEGVLIGAVRFPSPGSVWRKTSLSQRLIVLYAALTWLSAFLSPYFPETVVGVSRYEGALTISLYCACFLLVSVWGSADRSLLIAFGAAATAFGILSILQLLGKNPLHLFPMNMNFYDAGIEFPGEYLGTIGNTDLVSAYFCVAIPVFWIGLLRLKGRRRFLLLIPLALLLAALLRVRVAGGIAGVFLGGALCLPAVLPTGNKGRLIALILVLALLLAGAAVLYVADPGSGTLHELHEVLHGNVREEYGSGRIHIWRSVLEKLSGHWLLGWGPDTMRRVGVEPFSDYDPVQNAVFVMEIDAAHNEYLNILFHQGIVALFSLLAALAALCVRWVRHARDDAAAALLGGAALCYSMQALFGIEMCITAPFFWLSLALLEKRTSNNRKGGNIQCGES